MPGTNYIYDFRKEKENMINTLYYYHPSRCADDQWHIPIMVNQTELSITSTVQTTVSSITTYAYLNLNKKTIIWWNTFLSMWPQMQGYWFHFCPLCICSIHNTMISHTPTKDTHTSSFNAKPCRLAKAGWLYDIIIHIFLFEQDKHRAESGEGLKLNGYVYYVLHYFLHADWCLKNKRVRIGATSLYNCMLITYIDLKTQRLQLCMKPLRFPEIECSTSQDWTKETTQ